MHWLRKYASIGWYFLRVTAIVTSSMWYSGVSWFAPKIVCRTSSISWLRKYASIVWYFPLLTRYSHCNTVSVIFRGFSTFPKMCILYLLDALIRKICLYRVVFFVIYKLEPCCNIFVGWDWLCWDWLGSWDHISLDLPKFCIQSLLDAPQYHTDDVTMALTRKQRKMTPYRGIFW